MEFYIYSITYLNDDLELKREDGLIAANSYADAMEEIGLWDLSVEEVRLRAISGEYQEMERERPWITIEELGEALKDANLQLSTKPSCRCGCGKRNEESHTTYEESCNDGK